MTEPLQAVMALLKTYANNALERGYLANGTPLTPARRRSIMEQFEITEISAVDRPAQEGALAEVIKREKSEPEITKAEEQARREADPEWRANRDALMRELNADMEKRLDALQPQTNPSKKETSMNTDLMTRARDIAAREKIPLTAAMTKARRADPDAYSKHKVSRATVTKADTSTRKSSSTGIAQAKTIAAQEGTTGLEAMAKLRRQGNSGPYGSFKG